MNRSISNKAGDFYGLVDKSFEFWLKYFKVVFIYSLVFDLPLNLIENYFDHMFPDQAMSLRLSRALCFTLIGLFINSISFLAMIYVFVKILKTGKIPCFSRAVLWGFKRCWLFFYWSLIYVVLAFLWTLALIIPGLIFLVRYSLLPIVVAIEGKTQRKPLGQSKKITKNHLKTLFGINFLFLIIPTFAIFFCTLWLNDSDPTHDYWLLSTVLDFIASLIITPYTIMILFAYLAWTRKKISEISL